MIVAGDVELDAAVGARVLISRGRELMSRNGNGNFW